MKTTIKKEVLGLGGLLAFTAFVVAVAFFSQAGAGHAQTSTANKLIAENTYKGVNLFSATTTNATSTAVQVTAAEKVTFTFGRGGVTNPNTGSTRFSVQASYDNGTTWINYNKLVVNEASSTPSTYATVVVPAGTSTVMASMELNNDTVDLVRCIAVETTDGEHTCKVYVQY